MKLTKVEATVEINRPVNEVFAHASDWKHWKEWREGIYDLKPTLRGATVHGTLTKPGPEV